MMKMKPLKQYNKQTTSKTVIKYTNEEKEQYENKEKIIIKNIMNLKKINY